jgi:hypothetical protein
VNGQVSVNDKVHETTMRALIPQHPRSLPVGASAALWLAVFLSPTVYFLVMVVWNRSQVPAPPQGFVVSLFCVIPVVALLVCGAGVWRTKLRVGWRIGWLALTVLAMALQVGVLLVIIASAVTAAIALPQ